MRDVASVLEWLEALPEGTLVPPAAIAELLRGAASRQAISEPGGPSASPPPAPQDWAERIWTADADVRLTVKQAAEALHRSADWVYRHTSEAYADKVVEAGGDDPRLPFRKIGNTTVFQAGELRAWLLDNEEQVVAPRPPFQARIRAAKP